MPVNEWDAIISPMKVRSGTAVSSELPPDIAAQIQQLTGIELAPNQRQLTSNLPDIQFDAGLSDSEVLNVEEKFGFRFPPDLKAFLQFALPKGEGFPDWRSGNEDALHVWLRRPLQGVLFDVEHNGFWLPEWGARPEPLAEALRIVGELLAQAPKLIPIYNHRMMPDEPHAEGNPVFSVHQTDIIHYGFDLRDYLRHEFDLPGREPWPAQVRTIRFWDIDRFQAVRWAGGSCVTDPSTLPFATKGQSNYRESAKSRRKWWQLWK